jgi:oxygen-independent coproporphyrinogen-3 oxidase
MYEWTQDRMAAAGYAHYEISNWARLGRECRHNLVYWHNREYAALGAGAHGYIDGVRYHNARLPQRYIDLVDAAAPGVAIAVESMPQVAGVERVTASTAASDGLILGLRLNAGVDVDAYRERYGASPDELFGDVLNEFTSHGLLERHGAMLRLTPRGRLLSNELFVRLLPEEALALVE